RRRPDAHQEAAIGSTDRPEQARDRAEASAEESTGLRRSEARRLQGAADAVTERIRARSADTAASRGFEEAQEEEVTRWTAGITTAVLENDTMEWVETTAKTVEAAKDAALDQLGVAADEAEFEVIDEPRAGLFGRVRGEARVRARIAPAQVRPKQDRRRRGGGKKKAAASGSSSSASPSESNESTAGPSDGAATAESASAGGRSNDPKQRSTRRDSTSRRADQTRSASTSASTSSSQEKKDSTMSNDTIDADEPAVSPQEVGDAAVEFMDGLVAAFGAAGSAELEIEGSELDVRVQGEELGLLVGHGGRTLNAIQDLVRVAAQRRLGDHETRLRIDVARYRERRSAALVRFAADVAGQVRESGSARSLEPMSSADRKVIHDALNDEDGVSSRSEGDDPNRRVVVEPA
ncbi:MAG: RNA-binding cell elongation regulator Jag/EloR, partial [Actinomycetota bacterium]